MVIAAGVTAIGSMMNTALSFFSPQDESSNSPRSTYEIKTKVHNKQEFVKKMNDLVNSKMDTTKSTTSDDKVSMTNKFNLTLSNSMITQPIEIDLDQNINSSYSNINTAKFIEEISTYVIKAINNEIKQDLKKELTSQLSKNSESSTTHNLVSALTSVLSAPHIPHDANLSIENTVDRFLNIAFENTTQITVNKELHDVVSRIVYENLENIGELSLSFITGSKLNIKVSQIINIIRRIVESRDSWQKLDLNFSTNSNIKYNIEEAFTANSGLSSFERYYNYNEQFSSIIASFGVPVIIFVLAVFVALKVYFR